jgi:hypothetical protein
MRPASISVHVDHLVLDGVPVTADDGERVGAAVQAGLVRLLGADTALAQAPAGAADEALTVPAHADPSRLGDAIARAVHQRVRDASATRPALEEGTTP